MNWTTGRNFPCPWHCHDGRNRRNYASLYPHGDRLYVKCFRCGEHASATDAAEGVFA